MASFERAVSRGEVGRCQANGFIQKGQTVRTDESEKKLPTPTQSQKSADLQAIYLINLNFV
jgi:hypothetical protein